MKLETYFGSRKFKLSYFCNDGNGGTDITSLTLANLNQDATHDQIEQVTKALQSLIEGNIDGISVTQVDLGGFIKDE